MTDDTRDIWLLHAPDEDAPAAEADPAPAPERAPTSPERAPALPEPAPTAAPIEPAPAPAPIEPVEPAVEPVVAVGAAVSTEPAPTGFAPEPAPTGSAPDPAERQPTPPAVMAGKPGPDPSPAQPEEAPFVLPLIAVPVPEPEDDPLPGRPIALRLARLHLRTGALAIARAELEALAGRGALDEEALVDLAEVRWRTGDLPGAGEAANAAISRGRRDGIALVIAAETVSAVGRPSEARRLAARALGAIEAPLDPIFAGMPRSSIWPGDHMLDAGPDDASASRARAVALGVPLAASAAAAEAFAGGRAAITRGDVTTAAVRLGIALRLDPGFARGVLDIVEDRTEAPLLALVAGDALRLLGREDEALEAFDQARGRVTAGPAPRSGFDEAR